MAKFLIVSQRHELVPFVHRLKAEGFEAEYLVRKERFEKAWDGKLTPAARYSKGEVHPGFWERYKDPEWIVLTNHVGTSQHFPEGFGVTDRGELKSNVRLGGWANGGKFANALHLLFVDRGAWPGGLGPSIDSGLLMLRLDPKALKNDLQERIEAAAHELPPFKGLWQADFQFDGRELKITDWQLGWPMLQTHAFFSNQAMAGILTGKVDASLSHRATSALVVSIPPWPNLAGQAAQVPLRGLTPALRKRVVWHDVQVNPQAQELRSCGLDGLLGIVVGSAHTVELARGLALEVAQRLEVPEKQYRPDFASSVPFQLALFEERYGVVV